MIFSVAFLETLLEIRIHFVIDTHCSIPVRSEIPAFVIDFLGQYVGDIRCDAFLVKIPMIGRGGIKNILRIISALNIGNQRVRFITGFFTGTDLHFDAGFSFLKMYVRIFFFKFFGKRTRPGPAKSAVIYADFQLRLCRITTAASGLALLCARRERRQRKSRRK